MVDEIVGKVKLKADTSEAEAGAKKVEQSFFGAMVKSQIATQALNKTYDIFVSTLKRSISEAMESAKAIDMQNRALSAAGFGLEKYGSELQKQATALQRVTGISDETISSTQTLALNMGIMPEKIGKYVEAAIRLSRVTGNDLNGSLMALMKTETGVVDRTLKLVPGLDDLTKAQLAAGDAVDLVNARLSDQLELTDNFEGKWTRITGEFGNLLETLGTAVIEDRTVLHSLDALDKLLQAINASLASSEVKWADFGDAGRKAMAALYEDEVRWNALMDKIPGGGLLKTQMFAGWGISEDPQAAERAANRRMELLAPGEKSREETTRAAAGRKPKGGAGKPAKMRDLGEGPYEAENDYWEEVEKQRQADAKKYEEDLENRAALAKASAKELEDIRADHAERMIELAKKESEEVAAVAVEGMNLATGAIESLVEGGIEGFARYAAEAGKRYGTELLAKGAADMAMGIASSANPATPGAGAGQIAAAAQELALGAILFGGGLAAGAALSSGGGGGPSSVGAPGATATGGAGAGPSSSVGQSPRPSNTTVIIYGEPSARLGVLIRDSLNQANNRGV